MSILVLIAAGAIVYAINLKKKINVLYNDTKILPNSIEFTPVDEQGVQAETFIYEGTTYLPVPAEKSVYDSSEREAGFYV